MDSRPRHGYGESGQPDKKDITLDAPLTTALEARYGSGTVRKVVADYPLQHIGLENLVLDSEYAPSNAKDEDHA